MISSLKRREQERSEHLSGEVGGRIHTVSHPTLGRLSRPPYNDPQLMKKVKFFACAVSVFVCDGEGGWDKSAKYLHRYRQSKTANFKILTWTVLY